METALRLFERNDGKICADFTKGHRISMEDFHYHLWDELMLVETGECTIITKHDILRVNGPYVVFFPKAMPHQLRNNPNLEYRRYFIRFSQEALEGMVPSYMLLNHFFVLPLSEDMLALVRKYMELLIEKGFEANLEVRRRHLVAILLGELFPLLQGILPEQKQNPKAAFIYDVCVYIIEHVHEKLTIEEIAKHFFIIRTKLCCIFSEVLGMSVGDYIEVARMKNAKKFLLAGKSVQETAFACGYSSASYFIKAFRRCQGITPAQFRKEKM